LSHTREVDDSKTRTTFAIEKEANLLTAGIAVTKSNWLEKKPKMERRILLGFTAEK
jgi:hypothetical protein